MLETEGDNLLSLPSVSGPKDVYFQGQSPSNACGCCIAPHFKNLICQGGFSYHVLDVSLLV